MSPPLLPSTSSGVGQGGVAIVSRPPPSPLLADYIDPTTQDYVSLFLGFDVVDAQVVLALTLRRGTGTVIQEDGNKLRDIRKIGAGVKNRVRGEIRYALRRLIRQGDIRLVSVEFDVENNGAVIWVGENPGAQQVDVVVTWVNLRDPSKRSRSTGFNL